MTMVAAVATMMLAAGPAQAQAPDLTRWLPTSMDYALFLSEPQGTPKEVIAQVTAELLNDRGIRSLVSTTDSVMVLLAGTGPEWHEASMMVIAGEFDEEVVDDTYRPAGDLELKTLEQRDGQPAIVGVSAASADAFETPDEMRSDNTLSAAMALVPAEAGAWGALRTPAFAGLAAPRLAREFGATIAMIESVAAWFNTVPPTRATVAFTFNTAANAVMMGAMSTAMLPAEEGFDIRVEGRILYIDASGDILQSGIPGLRDGSETER